MSHTKVKSYLLMTLDPVHVGTGGYRLGRVDNSIIREPGTKLPKIPGTSLNGAIRMYASYAFQKKQCAGQSDHCGQLTCPICYTFGSISGGENNQQARAGTVNIFDAHILFFPVWSMTGPIWITTKNILDRFYWNNSEIPDFNDEQFASTFKRTNALNFGWVMLEPANDTPVTISPNNGNRYIEYDVIKERIAVVSDHMFSRIVNDNLEVRTSVSINPETGAAESGVLFTYEAIPRSTFMIMEMVVDDFSDSFPSLSFLTEQLENVNDQEKKELKQAKEKLELSSFKDEWKSPKDVFETGLSNIEILGVGGMGTRGFGRIRWVKSNSKLNQQTQNKQEGSKNGE
ncbi:MAG: type III-B CRISPR module RAMP protein Cmr4 [Spirochaetales bacterium]|nr:type III-B CRISPR module RAMP protein Cmr4 [Spirochaetales bacterium]